MDLKRRSDLERFFHESEGMWQTRATITAGRAGLSLVDTIRISKSIETLKFSSQLSTRFPLNGCIRDICYTSWLISFDAQKRKCVKKWEARSTIQIVDLDRTSMINICHCFIMCLRLTASILHTLPASSAFAVSTWKAPNPGPRTIKI